ncbi:MAG TPA: hypothetical protein PKE46_03805 [Micropruina sp.]|nr:hypothetical protein [Micropruina sp.]HMR21238.1 hypothetical protein [Micropruina sp.]
MVDHALHERATHHAVARLVSKLGEAWLHHPTFGRELLIGASRVDNSAVEVGDGKYPLRSVLQDVGHMMERGRSGCHGVREQGGGDERGRRHHRVERRIITSAQENAGCNVIAHRFFDLAPDPRMHVIKERQRPFGVTSLKVVPEFVQ